MTSSSEKKGKKQSKLVDVQFVRYDNSFIFLPMVMSPVVNKLLRRVPKGSIKLKNAIGSGMVIPTKLVMAIHVDGEEKWRNPAGSNA